MKKVIHFKHTKDMRNVLIPTDFSTASLEKVSQVIHAMDDQPMNIILFHAFEKTCTGPDLLGNSKRLPYADLLTDDFRNACRRIKTSHARKINSIYVRHMYGSTVPLFRNFIDAHDVDVIACPDGYEYNPVTRESVNPANMFKKSGITLLTAFSRKPAYVVEDAPLSSMVAALVN